MNWLKAELIDEILEYQNWQQIFLKAKFSNKVLSQAKFNKKLLA